MRPTPRSRSGPGSTGCWSTSRRPRARFRKARLPPPRGSARTTGTRPRGAARVRPSARHRYFFKLYALDRALADLAHPTKLELEAAMKGHILAQATLIGTYQKKKK